MAATLPFQDQCCTPCTESTTVNIPGATGAAGADGADGDDGVNAYTTTTALFTFLAGGNPTQVSVQDSTWIAIGQYLFIQGAGFVIVTAKASTTTVTIDNLDYPENTAVPANIAAGATVSAAGARGAAGAGAGDMLAANNLSDVADVPTSRTNLGLGTMAVQNANAVAITGGAIAGITDLAIADGGTGASTAPNAFDALAPTAANGQIIHRTGGTNAALAAGAATQVLHGGAAAVSWAAVTLTTDVAGVLPRANGGVPYAVRTIVAAGASNVNATDDIVNCNSAGIITLTLPDIGATPIPAGHRYIIKRNAAMAVNVVINPFAGDTVDGGAGTTLTVAGQSVTLASDGTSDWLLI